VSRLKARALVLERHGDRPRLANVVVDRPGPGEVRVEMLAAGVCHTDIAAVRDARTVPVVLGHEGVGVVESVGNGGDDALVGRRVLLSWKTPCGSCRRCAQKRLHLCETPRGTAAPRVHRNGDPLALLLDTGCFCTYVVVPAVAVVPVPNGLSDEHAAVVGCAVATGVGAALHTAPIEAGDLVAVWGAGGVGQNIVTGAKLAQAGAIVAVDPDPGRRAAALARGATAACHPDEALEMIVNATAGHGLDFAFEAVGRPSIMETAIEALGVGGTLVLVGAAARAELLSFQPRRFMSRQQRLVGCIYGSIQPPGDLVRLLQLAADGAIPLADLIGPRVTIDELSVRLDAPTNGLRTIVAFT
jgi:S-(hydroxymethyl)glutathione dehydrogenase/alcohol dehydrogenase